MGCPPVRGDNPRALASGSSYVQVDKHGITSLYHLHQCRSCASRDICAKVGKGGIISLILMKFARVYFQTIIGNCLLGFCCFLKTLLHKIARLEYWRLRNPDFNTRTWKTPVY